MDKLLYISNWPFKEGLTQSTVLPNLAILAESNKWEKIVFATLEFAPQEPARLHPRIVHQPFSLPEHRFKLWDRFTRWQKYRAFLLAIIENEKIDCIIARGPGAGVVAQGLASKTGLPYYVESFEPLADYMNESGVWAKWDPRYIRQRFGEWQVMRSARGLITVSGKFKSHLEQHAIPAAKIQVVPCSVDTDQFRFDAGRRSSVREQQNIPQDALVGINVGKYGGIYHDDVAFALFRYFFDNIPGYYQVFLTPDPARARDYAQSYGLPLDRCRFLTVTYDEVPPFLSAADFGFVLVKSTPTKRFCSPIKTGEYWACGLPVIVTENIGDDSDIIGNSGTGVVWDASAGAMPSVLARLQSVLQDPSIRQKNRDLAEQHRSRQLISDSYVHFNLI